MKKGNINIRLFKEEEKNRQVTHWDQDYLPKDKILDLYSQRETGNFNQKNGSGHAIDKGNQWISLLLIAIGLVILSGAFYVISAT